jgi:hypothetical protein
MTLIPWKLIALLLSWLVVAVGVYEHCQGEFEKERAVSQAALEAANQHAKEISDERESTVAKISNDLAVVQAKADKAAKDLRYGIADGSRVLRVAGTCSSNVPNDSTSAGGNTEAICNIDPGAAQSIVRLTQRGDEAIMQLNACIDAYHEMEGTE